MATRGFDSAFDPADRLAIRRPQDYHAAFLVPTRFGDGVSYWSFPITSKAGEHCMRNSILLGLILLAASAARADDYATRMLAATVKIYHKDSTAAGFLVIPPAGIDLPEKQVLLVTAGHVLERVKGDDVLLVLRKRQDDGT